MGIKHKKNGRWISVFTDKSILLPTLGSYKVAPGEQQTAKHTDSTEIDYKQRDQFTKTVSSLAVPDSRLPGIEWLRRKGYCLPREAEVLQSLRYKRPTDQGVLVRHVSLEGASFRTKAGRKPTSISGDLFRSWGVHGLTPEQIAAYSEFVHRSENRRKNEALRDMELRIAQAKANYYRGLTRRSTHTKRTDGITRRYLSEALDHDHRQNLPKLADGHSWERVFQEWKDSANTLAERQGDQDLRMVADYLQIIKEPKTLQQKRLLPRLLNQVMEHMKNYSTTNTYTSQTDTDSQVAASDTSSRKSKKDAGAQHYEVSWDLDNESMGHANDDSDPETL